MGEYCADIVVENRVIIELKTTEKPQKIHETQILNDLNATNFEIDLLVNFPHQKDQIKRYFLSFG